MTDCITLTNVAGNIAGMFITICLCAGGLRWAWYMTR